jgi:hypothetical protein
VGTASSAEGPVERRDEFVARQERWDSGTDYGLRDSPEESAAGVIFEKLIDPALATFVCGRPGASSISDVAGLAGLLDLTPETLRGHELSGAPVEQLRRMAATSTAVRRARVAAKIVTDSGIGQRPPAFGDSPGSSRACRPVPGRRHLRGLLQLGDSQRPGGSHCPALTDGLATGQQVTSSTAEQSQVTSQALAGRLGVSGSPLERQRQSPYLTGKF